jgi:DNA-binding XRE family transcriptional regulator
MTAILRVYYQWIGKNQEEPPAPLRMGPRMGRTPKTRRDAYGAWLHHLRKEKGLTQDEVAEYVEVPQSTLAYWERTGKLPGRTVIMRLARLFDVSVEGLLRVKRFRSSHPRDRSGT